MARAGTSVSSSAFPRFRELLEVRVAPQALCHLARVVLDLCFTRSFLVHSIHDHALPHDVLQYRLAFVETCP